MLSLGIIIWVALIVLAVVLVRMGMRPDAGFGGAGEAKRRKAGRSFHGEAAPGPELHPLRR
jgi:hypothetical protein